MRVDIEHPDFTGRDLHLDISFLRKPSLMLDGHCVGRGACDRILDNSGEQRSISLQGLPYTSMPRVQIDGEVCQPVQQRTWPELGWIYAWALLPMLISPLAWLLLFGPLTAQASHLIFYGARGPFVKYVLTALNSIGWAVLSLIVHLTIGTWLSSLKDLSTRA